MGMMAAPWSNVDLDIERASNGSVVFRGPRLAVLVHCSPDIACHVNNSVVRGAGRLSTDAVSVVIDQAPSAGGETPATSPHGREQERDGGGGAVLRIRCLITRGDGAFYVALRRVTRARYPLPLTIPDFCDFYGGDESARARRQSLARQAGDADHRPRRAEPLLFPLRGLEAALSACDCAGQSWT